MILNPAMKNSKKACIIINFIIILFINLLLSLFTFFVFYNFYEMVEREIIKTGKGNINDVDPFKYFNISYRQ